MALTRLLKIIALLYQMQPDEIADLSDQLLQQRKVVWRDALIDMAQRHGCTNASPRPPSGMDLNELKAMSDDDAKSIAATWNRDVEREVQRLYDANPRGNRYYYRKNMEAWAAKRSTWKTPQIALNTETYTREYARNRFWQMNGLRGDQFIADGPAPTCEICINIFAAGVVSYSYVQQHPLPAHINCPHHYSTLKRQRIACGDMWLG